MNLRSVVTRSNIVRALLFLFGISVLFHTRYIFGFYGDFSSFFEYGNPSIYAFDVIFILCFVFAVFDREYKMFIKEKFVRYIVSLTGALALLLFSYICIRGAFGIAPAMTLRYIITFLEVGFVLIASIVYGTRFVLFGVFCGLFIQNIFAIIQFFMQYIPACKWFGLAEHMASAHGQSVIMYHGERLLRAYGLSPHPNILGGMALMSLILAYKYRIIFSSVALYVFSIIGVLALFFSFSRGAIIGSIIFVVCALVIGAWKNKIARNYIISIIAVFAICGVFYSDALSGRVNSNNSLVERSYIERKALFEEWKMIIKNPVYAFVGTGIGNYTPVVKNMFPNKETIWEYQPVHSVPLIIFAEFGVFGVLLFLILVLSVLKQKNFFYKKEYLLFLSIIPLVLVDHYLWTSVPILFFVLIFKYYMIREDDNCVGVFKK